MPNLVGIGNSQVPTNAMLGGLAYQDPAHANLTNVEIENIAKIKAETSDTAVDVFVYDTRKDSDGGAWRKRTSNTSWYNEGVSNERGARKEFPAVAIVVLTTVNVIIYDGDDPNCSMWMKFDISFNNYAQGSTMLGGVYGGSNQSKTPTGIAMMNGQMWMSRLGVYNGSALYGALVFVDFIQDLGGALAHAGGNGITVKNPIFSGNISERNLTPGGTPSQYKYWSDGIINSQCLDVAITVLPDAPIDTDTGLPILTIAVGTDGGVSVLKDDGTVVDIRRTSDDDVHHVAFDNDRVLMYMELGAIYVATIPSADQSGNPNAAWSVYGTYSANTSGTNYPKIISNGSGASLVSMKDHIFASAGQNTSGYDKHRGLSILSQNLSSSGNGMVAWIKSNFNSGWMHGNCKGAFLSDTDDTNINGTSLIANGDFSSSSTAAFTTVSGGTAAVVGGLLKLTDTGGAFCYASAPFTTVVGNQYYVTVDIVNSSNTAPSNYIRCGNAHNGTDFHDTNYGTSYGTKTFYFIATATTTYLTLISGHGAGNPFGHWDNVFVYKLDNDRSINNKGLRPVGTVTKTAVATGAELVAYSNFSNSNYLTQNHNSDMQTGTGDFSVSCWFKNSSTENSYEGLIFYNSPGSINKGFQLMMGRTDSNKGLYFYIYGASADVNGGYVTGTNDGHWHCAVATYTSSQIKLYVDGLLRDTKAGTSGSINNSTAQFTVGRWFGNTSTAYHWRGDLALVRHSTSIPSAEQIKKIYDDEKHLFQENAKCTLYGSSNAVTAVAYDDSNDILHAGTSAGRSEFSGLNRINNTTTAVTAAISASNGLVAEQ